MICFYFRQHISMNTILHHYSWVDSCSEFMAAVATKIKDGYNPGNMSSAVIIKADSAAENILEITLLLWIQPSLWAKSNKKTFVRVWSSQWLHSQPLTGIFLQQGFNIRKILPLKAQITRIFSQASSQVDHVTGTKLKMLHLWRNATCGFMSSCATPFPF